MGDIKSTTEAREELHQVITKPRPYRNRITNEIKYMSIIEAITDNTQVDFKGHSDILVYDNSEEWEAIEETEAIKVLFKHDNKAT
jgi:hypothetical protein